MQTDNKLSIMGANIIYLITAVLLLTIGSYVQNKDIIKGLLITEYILVLLPPIIYIYWKKGNCRQFLSLNPLKVKHGLFTIFITILIYPVALFFNIVFLAILSLFGEIRQMPIPIPDTVLEYLILMGVVAISAGICEEFFFRGFLMKAYGQLGKRKAIWISAFLFALFHFNIQNFVGPMILGIIFGYLVYETNSLFAGIIGHITNNGLAVSLSFIGGIYSKKVLNSNINIDQMPNTVQLISSAVVIGIIALITGMGAYFLFRIIKKESSVESYETIQRAWEIIDMEVVRFPVVRYLPILLAIIVYIYIAFIQIMGMLS